MKAHRIGCAVALLTSACTAGGVSDRAVTVRDSAGVQIVENPGDDATLPVWILEGPRVAIGVMDGDSVYQLDDVANAMLSGDRIVVVNAGTRQLRFYDLDGRHVRTVGRQGAGPGEFEDPGWMAPHRGDSIAVYDYRHRRISVLDREGNFGRSLTPEFSFGTLAGWLADETYVVRPGSSFSSADNLESGVERPPIGVLRVSREGEVLDTLGAYPGTEYVVDVRPGQGFSVRPRPFGLSTQVAAGDSLIYVGTSDAWVINVFDTAGALRRSIRRATQPPPITSDVIERYTAAQLAANTDENRRRESERFYATLEYPERMPAYSALRVDHTGNLWVQDYVVSREDSLRWTVFDPSGRILSRLAMPPRMVVYEIGPDFVLGRVQDDLDVQQVVLFGLSRGPATGAAGGD